MSKSPWGKIGAWAADAELAEAEEREAAAAAAAQAASAGNSQKFPSLKESVAAGGKQKKKTKMTLQEFTMAGSYGSSAAASSRLTPEEMLRLPTGPKERSDEEMQHGRLGGGFSNYGTRSGGSQPGRIRDYESGGRRGYGGGFEDERRRGPQDSRISEFDQIPSRADEVDNWGAVKRSQPTFDTGPTRPNRYAALGGSSGGFSRADEVDSWASMKKPMPFAQSRSSSFGSGFQPGSEPDRWSRDFNSNDNNNQERPRLVLEPPSIKANMANIFGEARPREEVLAEKGLDSKKVDMEMEEKKVVTSRPGSSQSNRPGSSHSNRPGSSQSGRSEGPGLQGTVEVPAVKPKPRVNPFGDAKPREVLLEEKGLDWKKIDLELDQRRISRPETEEEKNLKEEIEHLKKESLQKSGEEQVNLLEVIQQKEKDLESLTQEMDNKVRFGQKATDRPGSGSVRYTGPSVRPPPHSGPYEEPRAAGFMDRPRSHGTGETWSKPRDDRRGFSGGRDRGFFGSKGLDRSRDRW